MKYIAPILTRRESADFERGFFSDGKVSEADAVSAAGAGIAREFLREFRLPESARVLVVAGGGHNGADALVAAREILRNRGDIRLFLAVAESQKRKPTTADVLENLQEQYGGQIEKIAPLESLLSFAENGGGKFDLLIEGLVGMTFRAPARADLAAAIEAANAICAHIKISVDIPAGAGETQPESPTFIADVTYCTGIVKTAVFAPFNRRFCGRIRFVDIGFFDGENFPLPSCGKYILRPNIFEPLKALRPAVSDKRTYGHAFVLAGSRVYAGAALSNVRAALRGGVGLVTAFVPETFAPQFAAAEPSAIWVGCPETEDGSIALESYGLIARRISRATAFLAGSGLTDNPETSVLVAQILKNFPNVPAVLDADAISPQIFDILKSRNAPTLATPHEGEILRIAPDASDASLLEACRKYGCSILLKSAATRGCDGEKIVYSTCGSPALSRAGSGDLLAGLAVSVLASRKFGEPLLAGLCASDWLGLSAVTAARELSETAIATSDIAKFLSRPLV